MSEITPEFYVTTPIYYVNARPHIGHAYTTIVVDVLARRHRLLGEDTFFLTGTDEHGQKIERSAAAAGIPPQQFADEVSAQFRSLWDRMGLTYSRYIRTTEECHKLGVQKLFHELYDRGHIYLSTYTGSYCVSDEAFVDQPAGTPCPDCGRLLETVTEENFFFKLSEFQKPLLDLIETNALLITPDAARNEVLSFVRGGLKDLSISRSSFTWGIPVPDDIQQRAGATQKHVVYVWLDALANYITAIGYGSDAPNDVAEFAKYWPADLHLVGKEITRFHCVYWPAFLLAARLETPKQITANGWLLFDNAKMSKSRGNVVRTETILDAFGDHVYGKQFPDSTKQERDLFAADVLRYYLLREIPFGQDGSFTFDALVTRFNADLANGYGNLISRVLALIEQNSSGIVPDHLDFQERGFTFGEPSNVGQFLERPSGIHIVRGPELAEKAAVAVLICNRAFRQLLFTAQVDAVSGRVTHAGVTDMTLRLVADTDAFLTANAPWKLSKSVDPEVRQALSDILYTAAESIRIITALLYPILPFATAKVWSQLGLGDIEVAARKGELNNLQWGGLQPGTSLGPLAPIFPRADKGLAQIMADMEDARTAATKSTPQTPTHTASASPATAPASTDPGAGPRTSASDPVTEVASALTVGGSTAAKPNLPTTPGPHTTAPASGPFATETLPSFIGIDDFMKVELRVAQVLVAERIPKADKLLRLEVDLGNEKRQILSGIAEWYTPEDLVGRRIVIVANLAPRKMRGLESHGMLLAASEGEGGKPVLATFGEDIALGARVR